MRGKNWVTKEAIFGKYLAIENCRILTKLRQTAALRLVRYLPYQISKPTDNSFPAEGAKSSIG